MKNEFEIRLKMKIRDIAGEAVVSPSNNGLNSGVVILVESNLPANANDILGQIKYNVLKYDRHQSSYEKFRKNSRKFYQLTLFPEFKK